MEKALKVGKLIAYAAETILAISVVADAVENLASRKAKAKVRNESGTADIAVPESK